MFSISISNEEPDIDPDNLTEENCKNLIGKITIGKFEERLHFPVCLWNQVDYHIQWLKAVDQLLLGKDSAFITSIHHPENNKLITLWSCHLLVGKRVAIQNQIFNFEGHVLKHDLTNLEESIGPYDSGSDDGNSISEWNCTVDDFLEFKSRVAEFISDVL